jgi:spermidine/putrescine transport system substrate-binding protein
MIIKYFRRFWVILFWIGLIFFALYFPTWHIFPSSERSLNIFSWGDIFDPAIVADFEKKTGIKIHLNYYSSNEELLVKLKATQGKGYDLVVPSDYTVKLLREKNLLKEIDKGKLTFWNVINPLLLGHAYDPENRYSVPFEWEVFGLGIDKDYFLSHPLNPSWKMIFDANTISYKISMLNDPIEALALANFYLYGEKQTAVKERAKTIKELLLTQKKWVEAYANFRGDYFLATRNCPVVVATSSYLRRTMKKFPFIGFVIPKEGTFITIENLCVPDASTKEDLVYEFINFIFEPSSIITHYQTFGFFPSCPGALDSLSLDKETREFIYSSSEDFKKFHFIKALFPQQETNDLWIEIKSEDR